MKGFGYQRPWVLINGMPSYGVDGLIVTSLPPITKPKMRYSSEEIDGRDGDIITTLGYQSYDKTVSVGLHGNFDIDKVIEFFATSGTITFSNEPDKVYRFQQLDSIDFDRLVRYRTADIKLHVQPFKAGRLQRPKVFTSADVQAVVTNAGNVVAAPKLTIKASGNIGIYLDGSQILSVTNTGDYTLIVDVANLEASTPEGTLMNRLITGDYQRLALAPGKHSIKWSGTVHSLTIEDYSRWI
jgi:phage-related protein|nr:MAG TPA: distal tail protein [Caudoviricetes sp.]